MTRFPEGETRPLNGAKAVELANQLRSAGSKGRVAFQPGLMEIYSSQFLVAPDQAVENIARGIEAGGYTERIIKPQ